MIRLRSHASAALVSQSDLWDGILAALGTGDVGTGQHALVTVHSIRENRRRLKILLAEDNLVNQRPAVRILEKRATPSRSWATA